MPLYSVVPLQGLFSEMPQRHGAKRKVLENGDFLIDEDMDQANAPSKRQCQDIFPDPSGDNGFVVAHGQLAFEQRQISSICQDAESSDCMRHVRFQFETPVLSPIQHVPLGPVIHRSVSPTPVENAPSRYPMLMDGELYNRHFDSDMESTVSNTKSDFSSNNWQHPNATHSEKCGPGCQGGIRSPVTNEIWCDCSCSGTCQVGNNNNYYVSDYY